MTEYTDDALYQLFIDSGLSERKFAKSIGENFNSVHGRLFRMKQRAKEDPAAAPSKEKVEFQANGNTAFARSTGRRIKSLDTLIEACAIDTEVWAIPKSRVNTWEGYRKDVQKDLVFDHGIKEGFVKDSGKLVAETLYQVEAHLVKKEPEAIHPVVSPVATTLTVRPRAKPKASATDKALLLADPHFGFERALHTGELTPFHDRRALSVALQIASEHRFTHIVVMGDILDLAEWSDRFVRRPEMYWTTQPALIEANWFLAQLRQLAPEAEVVVVEGNHDKRFYDLLLKHAYQAYELRPADNPGGFPAMSLPNLLGLARIGVEYIGDYPDGQAWITDEIVAVHGHTVKGKSGGTTSSVVEDAQVSTVFGHIHRAELATKTLWGRKARQVFAFAPGCLCRIDGAVPAQSKQNNWQQGIGIIEYDAHMAAPVPISIQDGRAFYQGEVYEADDYLVELQADTGWKF